MIARLIRNPWTSTLGVGVSLASLLLLAPGCGAQGPSASDAIVEVNEPTQGTTAGGAAAPAAPATTAANTPAAPAKEAAPADSAPAVKAEGWGTLKGRVVFVGDPPAPKVEIPQGKAPKDPAVCAVNSPILAEK